MTTIPLTGPDDVVALSITPNGIHTEHLRKDFNLNRLTDFAKVIGNDCRFVEPCILDVQLTMWVDEDAPYRSPQIPNPYATQVMAAYGRTQVILGTVIFTGSVSNRIRPLQPEHLEVFRRAAELIPHEQFQSENSPPS